MREISVRFLGENYFFPAELQEFVGYIKFFDEINEFLCSIIIERMKDALYYHPDKEIKDIMDEEGKKVITLLAEQKIFDVTLCELVDENRGWVLFNESCAEYCNKSMQIFRECFTEWFEGYENASISAQSKITGSGMSLYSNSMLAHMTFAAMETNTLKKQFTQADKQFRSSMNTFTSQNEEKQDRLMRELLYNELYPAQWKAIFFFTSELMEKYLSKLEDNNVFDYSKVKVYSIERSTELLNNVDLVSDKKRALVQAFMNCPYNAEVYNKAISIGLMDIETFKTSQIFEQSDQIIESIKDYCSSNLSNLECIEKYILIIALHNKQNEEELWRSFYSQAIHEIDKKYKTLNDAFVDNKVLDKWIRCNCCNDTEKFLGMSAQEIAEKISGFVTGIMTDKEYYKFQEKGLISPGKIRLNNSLSTRLQDINEEFINMLSERIDLYSVEAKRRKDAYEECHNGYLVELSERQAKISALKQKKKEAGLFALSKKKELTISILLEEETVKHLIADSNYKELEVAFKEMYRL